MRLAVKFTVTADDIASICLYEYYHIDAELILHKQHCLGVVRGHLARHGYSTSAETLPCWSNLNDWRKLSAFEFEFCKWCVKAFSKKKEKKKSKVCVQCGHDDAVFQPCPYAQDIHGDDTKIWLCDDCANSNAQDI